MGLPTRGEKFSELIEHLRKAAEAAATIGHLVNDMDGPSKLQAKGWYAVCQLLEELVRRVTKLAMGTGAYQ